MLFFIANVGGKNVIDQNPLGCILFILLQMLRFSKDKVGSKNEKNSEKTKERKGASDGYGHLNLSTLKSGQSKNSTKFLI